MRKIKIRRKKIHTLGSPIQNNYACMSIGNHVCMSLAGETRAHLGQELSDNSESSETVFWQVLL